jgi:sulfate permease, SulP family
VATSSWAAGAINGERNIVRPPKGYCWQPNLTGTGACCSIGSLLFLNSDYARNRIRWVVGRLPPTTQWFILDAEAMATVDSTAAAALEEVRLELFGLANLHSQTRKLLRQAGLLAGIGDEMLFERIEDAAFAFENAQAAAYTALDARD